MKKRVFLISLLAVLLSGCITLRIETKIKEDGSGSKSFIMAFDKNVISMIESMASEDMEMSSDDLWADVRDGASAIEGAKVEDYKDDDSEGIKIIVPFDSLDELQALSKSDLFEGADAVSVSEDGDTRTLKAVVSMGDVTSGLSEAGGEELGGIDPGDIDMEFLYTVDVEGKILEYSPKEIAEVEGSKITWDLVKAGSSADLELMVKWKPGKESGSMLVYLLIAIVVIAGGMVVLGIMMTLRKPKEQAAAALDDDQWEMN
jgi:hypothetical protein